MGRMKRWGWVGALASVALLFSLALLTSCGGGSGGGGGKDQAQNSDWDSLTWDQDPWAAN